MVRPIRVEGEPVSDWHGECPDQAWSGSHFWVENLCAALIKKVLFLHDRTVGVSAARYLMNPRARTASDGAHLIRNAPWRKRGQDPSPPPIELGCPAMFEGGAGVCLALVSLT